MVDETSNQQNSRPVSLVQLVQDWLAINKPGSLWRVGLAGRPSNPYDLFNAGNVLDGYGWYFTIYDDYLTAGIGKDRDGNRYDTGFLIDASDPEFFNKLCGKLNIIEASYPERHAEMMRWASEAVARMESAKRLRLLAEE